VSREEPVPLFGSRPAAADDRTADPDDLARALLDAVGAGVYALDLDGRCTFANRECVRLLGYDDQRELLGRNMHALAHHTRPDGSPYPEGECPIYRAHREGRGIVSDVEVLIRKDGTSFPVEYRTSPVDQDGHIQGSVLTFTEITRRRRAEEERDHGRTLQRVAGSVARLGGWSLDVTTEQVDWSEEIFEILGYPEDSEVIVEEALEQFLVEDRDRLVAALEACARAGTPFDLELQLVTRGGRRMWARVIGEARHGPDGTVTHVTGAHQDITEQKETESRIRRLAERLTITLESITDAFLTVDHDWRMTYVNRRAEQLLRRGRGDLLGQDLWEAFPQAVGGVLDEVYHRAVRTGVSEVVEDFHWEPLDIWLTIHAYPSEQGLAVYFRDVSAEHRARAQLARQAQLLDKASDAIVVRDLDHRITYWNRGAERIYGYPAAEALGRTIRELLHGDADALDRATETLLADGEWAGELVHVAKDGTELTVEGRWTLVRDDRGRPESMLAIDSDVTGRRRTEQQLMRAQRLESLGTLSGGIAHDLNNALTPILLTAQTLQGPHNDASTSQMLTIIEQSATRGAEMVRRVLSFARGVEGQRIELDLDHLVDDVVRIVRSTFPKNIRVQREVGTEVWPVHGDPTHLHQVLMNLCINARDAMPDGGTLRLAVDRITVDDHYVARDRRAAPGRYVRIRVEDDGTGIDPATMDRLFEPFFTTKAHGEGTGLGLSTSRGIVVSHGGFFQVSSEPGAGSAFDVHLPLADPADAVAPAVGVEAALPNGNSELVLLVDDEQHLRSATRRTLETAGYRVIEASDGTEAVPLFEQHAADVAAVVIDMMMPGMDGATTIRELLARRPNLPVIAVSGLTASREVARAATLGVDHFLAKPFTSAMLLATLRGLLERSTST
jgi:two-component system cell cycle sensor histidine kinase/response regulator CckA